MVWSRRRDDVSLATSVWSTLRFLAALVGRMVWFLAANATPLLGTYMALVLTAVMILASTVHLGIDEWDDVEQVLV